MMGQSAALPRPAGLPGVSAVAPQAAAQAAPQGDAEPGTAPADAASFDLLLGLDLAASTSGEPGQPATPGTTKFRPAGTRLPPSEAATADAPLLPALAHLPPSLSPTPIPVAVPPQPAAAPVVTTTAGGVTSTGAAASPQPAVPAAAAPMQGVVPAIAAPATPAPATTAPVATAPVTTAPETTTTAFGFPAGSPAVPDIDADAIGPANAAPAVFDARDNQRPVAPAPARLVPSAFVAQPAAALPHLPTQPAVPTVGLPANAGIGTPAPPPVSTVDIPAERMPAAGTASMVTVAFAGMPAMADGLRNADPPASPLPPAHTDNRLAEWATPLDSTTAITSGATASRGTGTPVMRATPAHPAITPLPAPVMPGGAPMATAVPVPAVTLTPTPVPATAPPSAPAIGLPTPMPLSVAAWPPGPAAPTPSAVTADTAPPLFATALAFAADAGTRGNAAATPGNEFASTVAAISEALGVTAAPHAGPSASEPPPHALLATGTPPPPAVPLTHGLLPATPVMQAAVTAAPVLAQPADPSAGYDDRFANHVSMLAGQRITQATIRVSPEHMGTIDIRLQVDGTQVRAEFHSARADVRQTLEASLPRLRDMLDQHGLQLAHAGVGQGRGQGQGQPQGHTHPTQPAGHDEAGILVLPGQAPSPLPPDFRHPHRLLDVYA